MAKRVALTMVERTMARRMLQSAREIPQFSATVEVNFDKVAAWRCRISRERRVSVTALFVWLTARALLKHPRLNAQFDDDAILVHSNVNMAVAIETSEGLVAPVIRKAETLSLSETAEVLKDLTDRATRKRLSLGDFKEATFTISNLGMFGLTRFAPIINPPQAAILAVGAIRRVMQADEEGKPVVSQIVDLTVTADHRVLSGVEVALFLRTLRDSVETAEFVK